MISVVRGGGSGEGGGGKSLVLATNPEIYLEFFDTKVVAYWNIPTTEIEIKEYRIYISQTQPLSLKDMTRVGETTETRFVIEGLDNYQEYWFAVESVSIEGYENASIWKVRNGVPVLFRFVAVGSNDYATILSSTNGTDWSKDITSGIDSFIRRLWDIVFAENKFVVVGENRVSGYYSAYSVNGDVFIAIPFSTTTVSLPNNIIESIAYFKGEILAYVLNAYGNNLKYSLNKNNVWTNETISSFYQTVSNLYSPDGNTLFLLGASATVSNPLLAKSTDAKNWLTINTPKPSNSYYFEAMAYGNGVYVLSCRLANSGTYTLNFSNMLYSMDGNTWVSLGSSATDVDTIVDIKFTDGKFIAVGNKETTSSSAGRQNVAVIYESIDGKIWNKVFTYTNSNINSKFLKCCIGNDRIIYVGEISTQPSQLSYYKLRNSSQYVLMSASAGGNRTILRSVTYGSLQVN